MEIRDFAAIVFSVFYLIVKPIISYNFIKLNNKIYNNGIEGEARLIEVKKMSYKRFFPVYHYVIEFYLKNKRVQISSRKDLPSSPGNQNDIVKIKYWDGYPYDVYIYSINYKFTYLIWLAEIIFVFFILVMFTYTKL